MCRNLSARRCAFWICSAPINELTPLETANLILDFGAFISDVNKDGSSRMVWLSSSPLKCQIFGSQSQPDWAAVHHGGAHVRLQRENLTGTDFRKGFSP